MNCKYYHNDYQGEWCDLHDVCNFSICKDRTDIKVEDWKLNSNDPRWELESKSKKIITNEQKAKEIAKRFHTEYRALSVCDYDSFDDCFKSALESMEWKDEQAAQEKQQLIDNACEWLEKYLFYLDKKDDVINNFKQTIKGE